MVGKSENRVTFIMIHIDDGVRVITSIRESGMGMKVCIVVIYVLPIYSSVGIDESVGIATKVASFGNERAAKEEKNNDY